MAPVNIFPLVAAEVTTSAKTSMRDPSVRMCVWGKGSEKNGHGKKAGVKTDRGLSCSGAPVLVRVYLRAFRDHILC